MMHSGWVAACCGMPSRTWAWCAFTNPERLRFVLAFCGYSSFCLTRHRAKVIQILVKGMAGIRWGREKKSQMMMTPCKPFLTADYTDLLMLPKRWVRAHLRRCTNISTSWDVPQICMQCSLFTDFQYWPRLRKCNG